MLTSIRFAAEALGLLHASCSAEAGSGANVAAGSGGSRGTSVKAGFGMDFSGAGPGFFRAGTAGADAATEATAAGIWPNVVATGAGGGAGAGAGATRATGAGGDFARADSPASGMPCHSSDREITWTPAMTIAAATSRISSVFASCRRRIFPRTVASLCAASLDGTSAYYLQAMERVQLPVHAVQGIGASPPVSFAA